MRHLGRTLMVCVSIPWASTCQAGNWSLGTNLGLSFLNAENQGSTVTALSWPGDALFTREPGVRLGFAGENRAHEFFIDSGMLLLSESGFSLHSFQLTGNYQYNFTPGTSPSPYVTAGAGLFNVGDDTDSSTVPSLGGGLGLQFHVAGGHGTIRSELRFDHFGSDETRGVPSANAFGFKIGFDLWMK
jgi:hypothetical protein